MEQENQQLAINQQNSIHLRVLTQLQLNPLPILSIHYKSSNQHSNKNDPSLFNIPRLYIVRETYSQIYAFNYQNQINVQQIYRFPFNGIKKIIQINGWIFTIESYQLKCTKITQYNHQNWNWQIHPFTTQYQDCTYFNSNQQNQQVLYSYHQKQTMKWWIENDKVYYRYLPQKQQPYHINIIGQIQGYGRKIKPIKSVSFTCYKYLNKNINKTKKNKSNKDTYLFIGDSIGSLHIYQCQFLTHLTTIKKHQASILTISINELTNTVYWSGIDSKVCSANYINQNWQLTGQVRGQSHDILALEYINSQLLVSGGLTTDLCFYSLMKNGDLSNEFKHKVSYSSDDLAYLTKLQFSNLLAVNKYTHFEIWQLNDIDVKLLVTYKFEQSHKLIKSIKIMQSQSNQIYIIVLTSQQTLCFEFNLQKGLQKHFTIDHSYQYIQIIDNYHIIGVKDSLQQEIQKINCKNGNIKIIFDQCQVPLITEIKIIQEKQKFKKQVNQQIINNIQNVKKLKKILIVGSKITNIIHIYCLKTNKILRTINCNKYQQQNNSNWNHLNAVPYTFQLVFIEYKKNRINNLTLIIKYFNQTTINIIKFMDPYQQLKKSLQQQQENIIISNINIGINKIRFGGWIKIHLLTNSKIKRYFYAISQGKIIFINNLLKGKQEKKIRKKQIQRIGTVAGKIQNFLPNYKGQSLILIGMNLKKMINQGKGAFINKKFNN